MKKSDYAFIVRCYDTASEFSFAACTSGGGSDGVGTQIEGSGGQGSTGGGQCDTGDQGGTDGDS